MVSVDEYGLEFTYGRDLGARDMGLSRSQNKGNTVVKPHESEVTQG